MNSTEFAHLLEQTYCNLLNLTNSKGVEYANDADQLANFKRLAKQLDLAPTTVLFVYLQKHLDSITTYVRSVGNGLVPTASEPIDGRIDDAILYLVLLKALIQCQKLDS